MVYSLCVWLHILAAAVWIGGMLFISYAVIPILRHPEIAPKRTILLTLLGLRIRLVGWITLGVLLVTGVFQLTLRGYQWPEFLDAAFWSSPFGERLSWKLVLFGVTVGLTLLHDLYFGPKSVQLAQQLPEHHPQRRRIQRWSSWLGRLIGLLALVIAYLGVLLTRGAG